MKKIGLIFLIILVSSNVWGSKNVIKIAAIFSQSGEAMQNSIEHLMTARYAIEEINRSGGILGKQISLIEIDNKSSALGSRHAAQKAVKENVIAVIGGSWSSHALGMARVLQKAKIPMITPTATNPKVTEIGNFIFRVCFIDSFQGKILAKFSHGDLKAKNMAVLTNTDQVYSIELARQFSQEFKNLGQTIVIELDYIETAPDFKGLIKDLSQYQFDAVFLPGYTRDSAQIVKTSRQMGIHVPFLGGDGWSHRMLNYASRELDNTYYLTHWSKENLDKKSTKFVKKISQLFEFSRINAGMALSYDAVFLLADAIARAGVLDTGQIRQALEMTRNYDGVTGLISFDSRRNPVKTAVILQFKNNKTRVVRQLAL